MADYYAVRVTGQVLKVDERSGTSANQQTGELRPWKMVTARVLVGGEDLAEVLIPDDVIAPDKGESVDWLVQVSARAGRGNFGPSVNLRLVGDWA